MERNGESIEKMAPKDHVGEPHRKEVSDTVMENLSDTATDNLSDAAMDLESEMSTEDVTDTAMVPFLETSNDADAAGETSQTLPTPQWIAKVFVLPSRPLPFSPPPPPPVDDTPPPPPPPPVLRDAAEVLAEMKAAPKRKRSSTSSPKPKAKAPKTSAAIQKLAQKPIRGLDLAVIWGQMLMPLRLQSAEAAARHNFIKFYPWPSDDQMATTRKIWRSFDPLVASKFLVPSTAGGVNSSWINEAANAMFEASDDVLRGEIGLKVANTYSHEKLRTLAALGFIGAWWWMREGLVWTLLQLHIPGFKVDDSEMKEEWDKVARLFRPLF